MCRSGVQQTCKMYSTLDSSFDDRKRKVGIRKLVFAILVLSMIFFLYLNMNFDRKLVIPLTQDELSCHYVESNNVLLLVEEISPAPDSIFFHETSCRGGLDSRQACSVESAARAHPGREIYVMFSSPVNRSALNSEPLATLLALPNVNLRRVLIRDYARGTPVEQLVRSGSLSRSRWRVSHTSDVLRYLTLYKWSGLYLDLDTVVVKAMDDLPKNFVTRENDVYVASFALAFYSDKVGRMISNLAVWDLAKSFSGEIWGQNGPMLITRVLKNVCGTNNITEMSAKTCKGMEVYGPDFLPLSPAFPEYFFQTGELVPAPHAYFYHIWNAQTQHLTVEPNSPYEKLARQYCPLVYAAFKKRM